MQNKNLSRSAFTSSIKRIITVSKATRFYPPFDPHRPLIFYLTRLARVAHVHHPELTMRRNTNSKRERRERKREKPFMFANEKRARSRAYDDEKCYDVFHRRLYYDLRELDRLRRHHTDRHCIDLSHTNEICMQLIHSERRTTFNLRPTAVRLFVNFAV